MISITSCFYSKHSEKNSEIKKETSELISISLTLHISSSFVMSNIYQISCYSFPTFLLLAQIPRTTCCPELFLCGMLNDTEGE